MRLCGREGVCIPNSILNGIVLRYLTRAAWKHCYKEILKNHKFKNIFERKKKTCNLVAIRKNSAWLYALLYLLYVKEVRFSAPMKKHLKLFI